MTSAADLATRRVDVVDDYFGTAVPDPYRWLEAQGDPEVDAWVDAQNARTRAYLDALPLRAEIAERLAELWRHERRGVPARAGEREVELRNDGTQEQDALWVVDADGERVVLAPNAASAVAAFEVSPDGSKIAVGVTREGSDWVTVRVLDAATCAMLPDRIEWLKVPAFDWLDDGSGLVFASFAPPPVGEVLTAEVTGQAVRLHRLGETAEELLWEPPGEFPYVVPHVFGDLLVVEAMRGTWPATVFAGRLGGDLARVVDGDDMVQVVDVHSEELILQSHAGAPNGRVIAVPVAGGPQRKVVAESDEPMDAAFGSVFAADGSLVVVRTRGLSSVVTVLDADGAAYDVQLPGEGVVTDVRSRRDQHVLSFAFASPVTPSSVVDLDVRARTTSVRFAPRVPGFDPADYVVESVEVPSGDVRVPVQVIRRRDVVQDGGRPTLLYGYGGFAIALGVLGFRAAFVPWLEHGGVLVLAGLRGGGERGERWHQAGMREQKQNVFDDAIAVAEWLVASGWTTARHLALNGGSNGGLLAAAVMLQRPDLFGAVVPEVGVLDMLRYQHFTGARAWVPEYGSAEEREDFAFLHAYSPVHNVESGRTYPPTLITTGDHDDRVPPGVHSYKFTATLQEAQGGEGLTLLRVQRDAGHGAGKAVSVQVEERADVLAFLLAHTG